jgi:hypothetical protein
MDEKAHAYLPINGMIDVKTPASFGPIVVQGKV